MPLWTEEISTRVDCPHVVHVYPLFDGCTHLTDGVTCFCAPDLEPIGRDDGEEAYLLIHHVIH